MSSAISLKRRPRWPEIRKMATFQPVEMQPGEFWTDDFRTAAQWFRAEDGGKRMKLTPKAPAKQAKLPKKA